MRRFLILSLILGLIYSCADSVEAGTEFRHPDDIVNPNGDSELALVMRNLHFEADKVRAKLENNESVDLGTLRSLTAELVTAAPTDSAVLDSNYYMLSDLLLQQVDGIPSAENQRLEFNGMVSACVTCHKNTCPGPIDKINLLMVSSY
jgi:hypothetical protein